MPEHVLVSEIETITDGGRRRRWTVAEKLRERPPSQSAEGAITEPDTGRPAHSQGRERHNSVRDILPTGF